nr:MAG TPA_asm: hypothetical protein [Caudoviricetes sp.]
MCKLTHNFPHTPTITVIFFKMSSFYSVYVE